jgi:hypothetical protein
MREEKVLEPGSFGHAAPLWLCISTLRAGATTGLRYNARLYWGVTKEESPKYCLMDYSRDTGYSVHAILIALRSLGRDYGQKPQWTKDLLDQEIGSVLPPPGYLFYPKARDRLRGFMCADDIIPYPDKTLGKLRFYSPVRIEKAKEVERCARKKHPLVP